MSFTGWDKHAKGPPSKVSLLCKSVSIELTCVRISARRLSALIRSSSEIEKNPRKNEKRQTEQHEAIEYPLISLGRSLIFEVIPTFATTKNPKIAASPGSPNFKASMIHIGATLSAAGGVTHLAANALRSHVLKNSGLTLVLPEILEPPWS
jgi:hypothetical protein